MYPVLWIPSFTSRSNHSKKILKIPKKVLIRPSGEHEGTAQYVPVESFLVHQSPKLFLLQDPCSGPLVQLSKSLHLYLHALLLLGYNKCTM